MSQHDDAVRLRHMLDAARRAVDLTAGKTRAQVEADEIGQPALARLLDIVAADLPALIVRLEAILDR